MIEVGNHTPPLAITTPPVITIQEGVYGILVPSYILCCPSKALVGYSTAYAQQKRWLRNSNNFRCPRQATREDLGKDVKTWLPNGENIIIYINANERIIKGPLGKQSNHLGFRGILEERHGHLEYPNSCFRWIKHIE